MLSLFLDSNHFVRKMPKEHHCHPRPYHHHPEFDVSIEAEREHTWIITGISNLVRYKQGMHSIVNFDAMHLTTFAVTSAQWNVA
jgi:hypothetical protein